MDCDVLQSGYYGVGDFGLESIKGGSDLFGIIKMKFGTVINTLAMSRSIV